MPEPKSSPQVPIYQLKVNLRGAKPPIWRRIQVPSDITLYKLHHILQVVMGWTDSHLHQFIVGRTSYGEPHPDYGFEMRSEKRAKLDKIAPGEGDKFIYEYDFGDGWEHIVLVEKILAPEEGVRYPLCLKGVRACPPEDVGGIWGYASFLEAIRDPEHPDHESMIEWIGIEFDPKEFDLEWVNEQLGWLR